MHTSQESSRRWLCPGDGASRPSTPCPAGSAAWQTWIDGCGRCRTHDRRRGKQRTAQMKKRWTIAACLLPGLCWPQMQMKDKEKDVRIGVLGLFHSRQIVLSAAPGRLLECMSADKRWPVQDHLQLQLAETSIRIVAGTRTSLVASITCGDSQGGQAEFTVTVPGKISRRYVGKVEIKPQPHELIIVVQMDMETAVASVVQAESPPHAPREALKAQAVATRS